MRACGAAAVPGLVSRLCASRSVSLEQGRLSCPPLRGHDDSKFAPSASSAHRTEARRDLPRVEARASAERDAEIMMMAPRSLV